MANNDEEKTEEPTGKRKTEARNKGQVAKSPDLSGAITLLFSIILLWAFSDWLGGSITRLLKESLLAIRTIDLNDNTFSYYGYQGVLFLGKLLLPILLILMTIGLIANVLQVGFLFTMHPLKPNFGKVFGISGFKRIVSPEKFVDLFKNLLKMSVVGYVGYQVIMSHYEEYLYLVDQSLAQILSLLFRVLLELGIKCALLLLVIGLADFLYQKFRNKKSLKMSKQEVKDEVKQSEGDPKMKAKIKGLRMEMHRKMMMDEVPKATVVVTNPTFIAIAIRYEQGRDQAPVVLAKGKRILAQKIKKIATENDIPIVEDKPLARGLFEVAEVGEEIPKDFFGPVAEILAYVYKLKGQGTEHAMS